MVQISQIIPVNSRQQQRSLAGPPLHPHIPETLLDPGPLAPALLQELPTETRHLRAPHRTAAAVQPTRADPPRRWGLNMVRGLQWLGSRPDSLESRSSGLICIQWRWTAGKRERRKRMMQMAVCVRHWAWVMEEVRCRDWSWGWSQEEGKEHKENLLSPDGCLVWGIGRLEEVEVCQASLQTWGGQSRWDTPWPGGSGAERAVAETKTSLCQQEIVVVFQF